MPERHHQDALPQGPVRGRGAGIDPGNRFDDRGGGGVRLHVLGEHLDRVRREHPDGVQVLTEVLEDHSRRVINRVDSPDLPFHWTLNPYRGCEHGCVYCYARPTHEMLGLSCGLDFETRIVAKRTAPALLERELASPRWRGEPIAMSGVTDPYQPQERELGVTRGCLRVMAGCGQPVGIVTKSRLVCRDIDLLQPLAREGAAHVAISVTTLDRRLAGTLEPRASAPADRLRAMRELAEAGVPVMLMLAPVIPGLTDHEIPAILRAAADAGARGVGWVLLRLPHQVKALFLDWLQRHAPERAARVKRAIRQTRDGALNDGTFGRRQRGRGPRAESIARTIDVFAARYGLRDGLRPLTSAGFRRPGRNGQLELFSGEEATRARDDGEARPATDGPTDPAAIPQNSASSPR